MKRVSLFTSSFRKKAVWRAFGVLIFVCLFFGIEKCMEFALINDTNEWSRAMFHDFYTRQENIDVLFLGSSHVYCGLDPAVLKEKTQKSCFNMATPAQPLNGSYYLLKEAVKYHDISHVYLELYFGQSTGEEGRFKEADQLPRNWRNTNYMKPSFNKLAYMLTMSDPSLAYLTFLPVRRYTADLFEPEKIKETVRQKRTENYRNYEVENVLNGVTETYVTDGFYYSEHKAEGGVLYDIIRPVPFSEKPMTKEAESYLRKIIEFCQKQKIGLTLYCVPFTDYQAVLHGNYDRYVSQVKEIAMEYELFFYDFNLCREGILDLTDDGLFRDQGHLNVYGAELFTACFAEFFKGLEEGTVTYEEYFYPTYQEKLSHSRERILGILVEKRAEAKAGEKIGTGGKTGREAGKEANKETDGGIGEKWQDYRITPIHNLKDRDVEYFIYMQDGQGERQIYADWINGGREGFDIRIPAKSGTVFIQARPEGETETTNFVQIEQ